MGEGDETRAEQEPEGGVSGPGTGEGVANCSCQDYHLLWPKDNLCYKEFSRGPCPEGHRYVTIHIVK